jgi:hypothetical protein
MNNLDILFSEARHSEPYLPGSGFTAAVMAQLPRRNELPGWIKNAVMLGATAIGSAIAVSQLSPANLISEAASMALSMQFLVAAAVGVYLASYGVIWATQKSDV